MSFKSLQVVRLTEKVRNTKGHFVPVGSRVVVVNQKEDVVKARYGTSKADYRYIEAPASVFVASKRGRPLGSGKKNSENVTTVTAGVPAEG